MKEIIIQVIKFGIVGLINSGLSYVIYLGMYEVGVHYLLCEFTAFLITIAISYILNSRYVFATGRISIKEAIIRLVKTYLSYLSTGFVLNAVLLVVWIEIVGIPGEIAPLISLLVTVPVNFLLNKFWIYRNGKGTDEDSGK